ncbi:unknown [Lachnospiraceae bacterium CAG:215]|nr:unknown [Lachnospiraceae bacterium CAG:215]
MDREPANAVRSRGLAVPYVMRVIRRSRSYTGERYSRISSLEIADCFNSSTASSRLKISCFSISGCSMNFRSIRAPIAVFVLSNTQRRDPLFCFSRNVSHNSRFLRVELSSIIYFPVVYGVIRVICDRSFFCVSSRYWSNAPALKTPQS